MSNAPPPGYLEKSFSLRYALGDIVLMTKRLQPFVKEFTLSEAMGRRPAGDLQAMPLAKPVLHRTCPVEQEGPALTRSERRLHYTYITFARYYFDFSGGYEAYLARFSSKRRFNAKREHKIFVRESGMDDPFWVARTLADLPRFRKEAREVATKTYQERLWNAAIPDTEAFWAEVAEAAQRGDARGYIGYVNGVPVSYALCTAIDGDVSLMYVGYDPQHQQHSPGRVLLWYLIEDLYQDGCFKFFDFGEGHADYKKSLSTGSVLCGNVLHLEDTLLNRIQVRTHMKTVRLSRALGERLDRWGLKQRIKKFIRRA